MEYLRELPSGSGPAAGGFAGPGSLATYRAPVEAAAEAPKRIPPARFADTLFEEGARAGPPRGFLARPFAAPDPKPPPGKGERPGPLVAEPHVVGRESAPAEDMPESDLSLADLIDVINPLQHIPLIANLYRDLTGDSIGGPARVAGGALYGGPFGMLAGALNAIVAEINGADLGGTVIAGLFGQDTPGDIRVAGGAADPVSPSAPGPVPVLAVSFAPHPGGESGGDGTAERSSLGIVPAPAFAQQMMRGLDKYRALAVERGGTGRPAPDRLDRRL